MQICYPFNMGIQYSRRLQTHHEKLIIEHLRKEWIVAEKALKQHEIVEKAAQAGMAIGRTLLGLALVAGALTIAVVAPNAFAAFGKFNNQRRYLSTRNLSNQLRRGSANKYWHYAKISKDTYQILLTSYGKQIAFRNALQKFKLFTRPQWDGKWRMVIFDIENKYSSLRDALRRKLIQIGMYPLQESVFVYPYPCTEEVLMWVDLFGVNDGVEIIEENFIKNRTVELKRIFNLPLKGGN